MAWSYSVFDEVRKPTVKELQEQYIQKGVDSSCAFSMACADYEIVPIRLTVCCIRFQMKR